MRCPLDEFTTSHSSQAFDVIEHIKLGCGFSLDNSWKFRNVDCVVNSWRCPNVDCCTHFASAQFMYEHVTKCH